MKDRPLMPEGEEHFPNTDFHHGSPETDELGVTTIAVALDPAPPPEGWALDAHVAVRAELTWTGVFKWWCLGHLHEKYKVMIVRADDASGSVLEGMDVSDRGGRMIKPPSPYPPPPSPDHSTMSSWCNWDLLETVRHEAGRYWVMGTVDGRRTKPIPFRLHPAPDPRRATLDAPGTTKIEAHLDAPVLPAGAPVLLRGTVYAGIALHDRSKGDVAAQVLLVVVRVRTAWSRPPEWTRPMPHDGDLVPDGEVVFVKLSDAAGAKLRPSGRTLGFEVDLAAAAGIDKAGRYWVLVTADGEIGEAIDFEVR